MEDWRVILRSLYNTLHFMHYSTHSVVLIKTILSLIIQKNNHVTTSTSPSNLSRRATMCHQQQCQVQLDFVEAFAAVPVPLAPIPPYNSNPSLPQFLAIIPPIQ
jgi:hypothetical protein